VPGAQPLLDPSLALEVGNRRSIGRRHRREHQPREPGLLGGSDDVAPLALLLAGPAPERCRHRVHDGDVGERAGQRALIVEIARHETGTFVA
jgi:hypothetical protein